MAPRPAGGPLAQPAPACTACKPCNAFRLRRLSSNVVHARRPTRQDAPYVLEEFTDEFGDEEPPVKLVSVR